jgi:uncharacterized membrane protein
MSWKRVAAVALAAAIGTVLLRWWGVVLVGAGLGLVETPRIRPGLEAAAGCALGWALLLGWAAFQGPVWLVARRVGPIFHLPAAGFSIVTLGYGALLAASAAVLVAAARQR